LRSFQDGAGTVLFFEDQDAVGGLQAKFAAIADKFPVFSEHSSGMAQFAVWSALAAAGIGASLQHYYEPLVDERIAATWDVPSTWKMRAQMPFGSNEAPLNVKTFIDDAVRFRVLGE
jgi:predicted oxidoreductase (fatty acid repression mutant protein)